MSDLIYEITSGNYKFINPYNFVYVNLSKKSNFKESPVEAKLTGVLKCSLYLKKPIAIPETDFYTENNSHKTFKFFSYGDDVPVIPGSSLRGVIRSVYETLTDSCMVTAKEKANLTARSSKPFQPAVLIKENDKWEFYSAKRYCVYRNSIDRNKFRTGDKVSFTLLKPGEKGYDEKKTVIKEMWHYRKDDENSGYLFIGEDISKKEYESVFITKQIQKEMANEKIIKTLDEIYKIYNENSKKNNNGTGKRMYRDYEYARNKGVIPIWYDAKGKKVSLACIGRIIYDKNMGEVLKKKTPCKKRNNMCKACSLFGMAAETESMGSKIRISDAFLLSNSSSYELKYEILKPLSSPKYSHLPFYIEISEKNKNPVWSYDNYDIRGRKYYWHSDSFEADTEASNLNATMQLLKPIKGKQAEFGFDIFFDGITREQLDELIWSLTLGENTADSSLCYKIGHGKPLGLGSVKITVNKKCVRTFGESYTVSEETIAENPTYPENSFNEISKQQLLKMANIHTTEGESVVYPYVVPDKTANIPSSNKTALASIKWFTTNFTMGKNPKIERCLPYITEDDIRLDVCSVYRENNNKQDKEKRKTSNKGSVAKYKNIQKNNPFSILLEKNTIEQKTEDKNIVFDAKVVKIDTFINILLSDGTTGTLEKKRYMLNKGDSIKVKLSEVRKDGCKVYKLIKE